MATKRTRISTAITFILVTKRMISGPATSLAIPAQAAFVVDPFEQQPGPEPGTVFFLNGLPPNVNAITADMTDPANVVAYSGDDPSPLLFLLKGAGGRFSRTRQLL